MSDYGKVHAFGTDRSHQAMLGGPVEIEEKIDGSQFTFYLDDAGDLVCRSRSRALDLADPRLGQFAGAVATARALADRGALDTGRVFRGEVVSRPRHNVLTYQTTPPGCIVLWSVEDADGPLGHEGTAAYARIFGLICAPLIVTLDPFEGLHQIEAHVLGPSVLGGEREGIVLKCGALRAKIVGERFREVAKTRGRAPKGTREDLLFAIGRQYGPVPRWEKALGRLRDAGELRGTPGDIGALVREVQRDIQDEAAVEITAAVMAASWGVIGKAAVDGLALWYKERLAE